MKRSEINAALKDMEKMIEKCGFKLPPFCHLRLKNGRRKAMIMTKCVKICWAGILQIMA